MTQTGLGNPQGQLTLIDTTGTVLLSGNYLLVNADLLDSLGPVVGSLNAFLSPFVKLAP